MVAAVSQPRVEGVSLSRAMVWLGGEYDAMASQPLETAKRCKAISGNLPN